MTETETEWSERIIKQTKDLIALVRFRKNDAFFIEKRERLYDWRKFKNERHII
jgi:hypothetical protein